MYSNQSLINLLIQEGYLQSPAIIKAFQKVDRADFVSPEILDEAYANYPLPIGLGQTISQPATVAFMLELLKPQVREKILDVGSGSGWQTALLAEIVGPSGLVIGLEIKDELVRLAKNNLSKYGYQNIKLIRGNGWQGLLEEAPFTKIIVAAAASEVPQALKEQLKIGGRLVIPVGQGLQDIVAVDRISQNKFTEHRYPGFVFVPLVNDK
jgi:protein-L-isoaspartate(D-aspartate) O-methyltransferase